MFQSLNKKNAGGREDNCQSLSRTDAQVHSPSASSAVRHRVPVHPKAIDYDLCSMPPYLQDGQTRPLKTLSEAYDEKRSQQPKAFSNQKVRFLF